MSKRKDIETLRKYAREDQNGTGWFERNNIAQVVRRLFLCDGDPLIKFAGSDLAGLRRALDDVPMTRRDRENVGRWLDKLQSAMETETPEADERERHAERAIETLTNYLSGIDAAWHNYHLAAEIAKGACKSMLRIRSTCPTYDTSKGPWVDATEHAVMALSKLKDHARIIEIKEQWQIEEAEGADATGARQRVIATLAALREPMSQGDPQLARAFDQVRELLNLFNDDPIPF